MVLSYRVPYCGCGGYCLTLLQEDVNEYQLDDFVVQDGDISEEEGERRRRGKKRSGSITRKRLTRATEEHGLDLADEEDLELIREAQGERWVA